MSKKNYELIMTTNGMCQKRTEIVEAIKKANEAGIDFKANVVMGKETTGVGQFPVFIDSAKAENQFAVIKELSDECGKKLDNDEIIEIVSGCEYTVNIKQVLSDDKTIMAEFVINKAKAIVSRETEASVEVEKLVAEKVAAGIVTQEEADKKVKVMLKNYVDDTLMQQVISGWKKYKKSPCRLRCEYIDPYLEDFRKENRRGLIAKALRNAVNRYAIIEEGEKSVGKNVFVETIAWLMGMPLYLITFSRNMSPSSVYGEKSTDNTASEYFKTTTAERASYAKQQLSTIEQSIENVRSFYYAKVRGTTEFDNAYEKFLHGCAEQGDITPLIEADGGRGQVLKIMLGESSDYSKTISLLEEKQEEMKQLTAELERRSAQAQSVNIIIDSSELYDWLTIGGLMVFNEMNMAEPNFFASFTNQLTDGTGFLFIPGRGEVKIREDCVLCGTQNADYEGVEQQNEASMSRFGCNCFKQPQTIKNQLVVAVETELRSKGYSQKLDIKYVDLVEKFYKSCQGSVDKNIFTNAVLNIRGFVRALTNVTSSDGNALLIEEVEDHVINTCPVDERPNLTATARKVFAGS